MAKTWLSIQCPMSQPMVYTQEAPQSSAGPTGLLSPAGPARHPSPWLSPLCAQALLAEQRKTTERGGLMLLPYIYPLLGLPGCPRCSESLVGSFSVPQLPASTLAPSFPLVLEAEVSLLWTAPDPSSSCILGGPLCLSHLLSL